MAYEPCNNPQCPSYGKPHPNCRCYAHGGAVYHEPDCEHFVDGGSVMPPESALGHAAIQYGLSGLLKTVGQSDKLTPEGHAQDYLDAGVDGHDALQKHSKGVLALDSQELPKTRPRKALEEHLDYIRSNPQSMLDVGGAMGDALPDHGALLSARSAQAVNYLESLRPMPQQGAPLDKIAKVSPAAQQKYNRQLDIAEQPLLVLRHVKAGTLLPQDLTTVQTLYPKLYQNMVAKMTEKMIESKGKKSIPRHQRRALGLLLGQPLDSTMTPAVMQAIIQANAGASKQESQPQKGGPRKATGAELKETSKAAKLYGTHAQDKELGK